MRLKIAVAGQPNCGKSTVFNMLSGLHQHIANYPGITVDKKSGFFNVGDIHVEMVDLPGTYSMNHYSLEEKVAKEFIIKENPDVILNIVDASNLKRNLYLTFQLLEIGKPVIIVLNMCDVAQNRGMIIDEKKMSDLFGCPVIRASASKGLGKDEILSTIKNIDNLQKTEFRINYKELEDFLSQIESALKFDSDISNRRWFCIKVLEKDSLIVDLLRNLNPNIDEMVIKFREDFLAKFHQSIEVFLAKFRYDNASIIFQACVTKTKEGGVTLTDRIDKIVLNRWLSFPILLLVIFVLYELSIVFGYKLTDYIWPFWAAIKNFIVDISPANDIANIPMISDLIIWLVNSAIALLNYLPIFFILFALIAIMEDVGYMPRIAFVLDRAFRKFGLHGQSTLPLVLSGAFVGGCAVPGVMATKGIADERARMATIITAPLMNCLAKVPFYTLILGAFFANSMSIMLFYISTSTILAALIIAKVLTSTVLKTYETAPFVMELPPYHMPTFKGVILRAFERVWIYIKKVCTIVIAVAIMLFALLQFPGLSKEKQEFYHNEESKILNSFDKATQKTKYYNLFDTREEISDLLNFYDSYRSKKMSGSTSVDKTYQKMNADFYSFVKPPKGDADAKKINQALRNLSKGRNKILLDQKSNKIENSLLGTVGRALEPISKFAGFDWKINVAFLSSFAARESAVATLGTIYETGKNTSDVKASDDDLEHTANMRPEEAMAKHSGYTPLHATSIIIFMLLTPPCIATMIVVKMQTNSYGWMFFAILFPFGLGLAIASLFFTVSSFFGFDGLTTMTFYYLFLCAIVIVLAVFSEKFGDNISKFKAINSK